MLNPSRILRLMARARRKDLSRVLRGYVVEVQIRNRANVYTDTDGIRIPLCVYVCVLYVAHTVVVIKSL